MATIGLVLAVALSSCGGGSPAAASHPAPTLSTTAPTTHVTAAPLTHVTPASVLPTLNRALAEQTHRQYAAAVVDLLTVVKADPSSQIAWYDLGYIAQLHAETAQAISDYNSALDSDPSYVPALYNLATLEAATQPTGAVVLYNDVIRLEPRNAAAHLNLALVLASIGSRSAAKTEFAEAIRLEPALQPRVPAAYRTPA